MTLKDNLQPYSYTKGHTIKLYVLELNRIVTLYFESIIRELAKLCTDPWQEICKIISID